VVSFHTVPAGELIEQRAVDDEAPDSGLAGDELYAGRTAR
jgi:hypothetical protein